MALGCTYNYMVNTDNDHALPTWQLLGDRKCGLTGFYTQAGPNRRKRVHYVRSLLMNVARDQQVDGVILSCWRRSGERPRRGNVAVRVDRGKQRF